MEASSVARHAYLRTARRLGKYDRFAETMSVLSVLWEKLTSRVDKGFAPSQELTEVKERQRKVDEQISLLEARTHLMERRHYDRRDRDR